jgi:hypothetical protein
MTSRLALLLVLLAALLAGCGGDNENAAEEQTCPARDGDIESAFEGYKEAFEGTGYSVTKEEREDVDAEVNFSCQGVAGQVKLLQLCKERTDVSITIRPA